jgi:nitrogen fixation NifU-like protein
MALSQTALAFAQDARHRGELRGATHFGQSGCPGEGPFLQIWLRVADGRIVEARYHTYGCPTAMACGALACQLLTGRTLEQAALVTSDDLVTILVGVPEGKEHCPRMAQEAIAEALKAAKGD